eukprot:Nitzschia sp. Nitz4//scaffold153_size53422//10481//13444//NITZ4_006759-RA/size53422-processed-gene-0.12-mRNA-1//1//CDS//3329537256//3865//frame0
MAEMELFEPYSSVQDFDKHRWDGDGDGDGDELGEEDYSSPYEEEKQGNGRGNPPLPPVDPALKRKKSLNSEPATSVTAPMSEPNESFSFEINLPPGVDVSPLSCKESVIAAMMSRSVDRALEAEPPLTQVHTSNRESDRSSRKLHHHHHSDDRRRRALKSENTEVSDDRKSQGSGDRRSHDRERRRGSSRERTTSRGTSMDPTKDRRRGSSRERSSTRGYSVGPGDGHRRRGSSRDRLSSRATSVEPTGSRRRGSSRERLSSRGTSVDPSSDRERRRHLRESRGHSVTRSHEKRDKSRERSPKREPSSSDRHRSRSKSTTRSKDTSRTSASKKVHIMEEIVEDASQRRRRSPSRSRTRSESRPRQRSRSRGPSGSGDREGSIRSRSKSRVRESSSRNLSSGGLDNDFVEQRPRSPRRKASLEVVLEGPESTPEPKARAAQTSFLKQLLGKEEPKKPEAATQPPPQTLPLHEEEPRRPRSSKWAGLRKEAELVSDSKRRTTRRRARRTEKAVEQSQSESAPVDACTTQPKLKIPVTHVTKSPAQPPKSFANFGDIGNDSFFNPTNDDSGNIAKPKSEIFEFDDDDFDQKRPSSSKWAALRHGMEFISETKKRSSSRRLQGGTADNQVAEPLARKDSAGRSSTPLSHARSATSGATSNMTPDEKLNKTLDSYMTTEQDGEPSVISHADDTSSTLSKVKMLIGNTKQKTRASRSRRAAMKESAEASVGSHEAPNKQVQPKMQSVVLGHSNSSDKSSNVNRLKLAAELAKEKRRRKEESQSRQKSLEDTSGHTHPSTASKPTESAPPPPPAESPRAGTPQAAAITTRRRARRSEDTSEAQPKSTKWAGLRSASAFINQTKERVAKARSSRNLTVDVDDKISPPPSPEAATKKPASTKWKDLAARVSTGPTETGRRRRHANREQPQAGESSPVKPKSTWEALSFKARSNDVKSPLEPKPKVSKWKTLKNARDFIANTGRYSEQRTRLIDDNE